MMRDRWIRFSGGAAAGCLLLTMTAGCSSSRRSTMQTPALINATAPAATSRTDLARTIAGMQAKLASNPADASAALALADALLRQTRVTGNAGLAVQAETALNAVLHADPRNYNARRLLGAVLLSQHRFREAVIQALRCQDTRSDDAYVYGVLGDAHLELGDYPDAFAAFDRMAALRPNAASYARASYAHELQGDLDGALKLMRMAADATGPQDAESLAWHHAQIGHLLLESGRLEEARRAYAHADFDFPGHPFAVEGLARVSAAAGDPAGALEQMRTILAASPTPAAAAFAGDLLKALGRDDEAEREYRLAEAAWQIDAPEPARLARFLAEHGRRIHDAATLAERAAAERRDIFTMDALAWAYFQVGDIAKARTAMAEARRTGSRDRQILFHAAAIERASGHPALAKRLASDALDASPRFDPVSAPAAAALLQSLSASTASRR